jgi:hypothetical protein
VAEFKVLPQHLPGGTEENYKQPGEVPSLGRDLKQRTSRVRSRSGKGSTGADVLRRCAVRERRKQPR